MKKRKIRGVLGTNGSEVVYLHHFDFICSRSASNCVKIEINDFALFLAYPKRQKKNKKIVSKNQGNILSIEMPKNEK